MDNVDILKLIETTLKTSETDRDYLADQLVLLANVIRSGKDNPTGVTLGALGGLLYAAERLKETWDKLSSTPTKSLHDLKQTYAEVELSRFATTQDEIKRTLQRYLKDCVLVYTTKVEVSPDRCYFVFASLNEQTTVDGRKLSKGEVLDSVDAWSPSFRVIARDLLKLN